MSAVFGKSHKLIKCDCLHMLHNLNDHTHMPHESYKQVQSSCCGFQLPIQIAELPDR